MSQFTDTLKGVRVQRLFLFIVLLKVSSSFLSWIFASPWILGFAVPLTFMAIYIFIGLNRSQDDVSDEKFADSCYYLGFIFTITSIIVSLFDLPNLQTNLSDISVRFGAAMVSTVFGLIVRVYLVNFKKDSSDLTQEIEDQLIESANIFRTHLELAVDSLKTFELAVDNAVKDTVARVEISIEKTAQGFSQEFKDTFSVISKKIGNAADKSSEHLKELAVVTMSAADQSSDHMSQVAVEMSKTLKSFSTVIMADMQKFEEGIQKFTTAIDGRLSEIKFPDEYFSEVLRPPLNNLSSTVGQIGSEVESLSNTLKSTNLKLSSSLNRVSNSAEKISDSMDNVNFAIEAQESVLEIAQKQSAAFDSLASNIRTLEEVLKSTVIQFEKHKQGVEDISNDSKELTAVVRDDLMKQINSGVEISSATSSDVKMIIQALGKLSNQVEDFTTTLKDTLEKSYPLIAEPLQVDYLMTDQTMLPVNSDTASVPSDQENITATESIQSATLN